MSPDQGESFAGPSWREAPTSGDDPAGSGFVTRPPPAAPATTVERASLGRIGPYALLAVLGEGGFGTVYLAEQASPRRHVALKILKPDVAAPKARARFAHEAETLARLRHAGIAQVFEAGLCDPESGQVLRDDAGDERGTRARPFFVMEYIEGEPLTEHARRRGLPTRERLELVRRICDAVQHAHLSGVVHRDLKPANILVDGSGQPKVLDFGVARVSDEDVQRVTIETGAGQLVGTVPYMSPEQIRADPAAIDGRSDVYTLGVITYELLAGRLPYDLEHKRLHEATAIICEDAPTHLDHVNRAWRGDLDTIVLKALEKDRDRRYQSAAELSEDLRRFLADEPIVARPPSKAYELRKFARRNRALVGGLAATIVVLAAGVIATAAQAVRATRAEAEEFTRRGEAEAAKGEALRQRDAAQREASKSLAAVGFLERALEAADPGQRGRDVRLADVLDGAAAQNQTQFAQEPEVRAALSRAMARAYRGLGLYDEAEREAAASLEALAPILGLEHPETLDLRETLALIHTRQSRHAQAEAELKEVLAARRRIFGERSLDSYKTLGNLAWHYGDQGRYQDAEAADAEAVAGLMDLVGPEHPQTLEAILHSGEVLMQSDRIAEGERLIEQVLEARTRLLPPDHPDVQEVRDTLCELRRAQGRFAEAIELTSLTLAAREKRYGPDHPHTLAKRSDLGRTLEQAGRLEEAEAVHRRVLDARLARFGPDHFDTQTSMGHLSAVLQALGRLEEAEQFRRTTVQVRERTLGPEHPQTLVAMNNHAFILSDLRRYDEAEAVALELLARRERVYGAEHVEVAYALSVLGHIRMGRGDFAAAEPIQRRCLEIRAQALPEGDFLRGFTMTALGDILSRLGRYDEAEPLITTGAEWVLADSRSPARNRKAVVERAVRLYEAVGNQEQAGAWRARQP